MSADPPTVGVSDNVRVEVYDTDADALGDAPPREVMTVSNVTCIGLHKYIPQLLDFTRNYEHVVDHAKRIAFGDDASTFTGDDTAMNNRVGSVALTDASRSGARWHCSELVGTLELNGENLRELGVESDSGKLWNHAPLPTPIEPKTTDDALLVNIDIKFDNPL